MADVLVVGCGYLGRRVAALCRERGREVAVTTRRSEGADEFRILGLEPVVCDVLDPESLKKLPTAGTTVYCVGFDRSAGRSMRQVYVDGLRNVLHTPAVQAGSLIYVSSTGVYGQTDGEEVDETAAVEPQDESGRVVLDAERLLAADHPRAVILRFAGIYGPGRLLRAQSLLAGEPLAADPEKWLNLIHVEDGAAAVLAASDAVPGAIYNVSDGSPVRRRDFYTELARLLGAAPPRFVPLPDVHAARHDRGNRRIVGRRLRDELGFRPRYPSYVEGLAASR